MLTLFISREVQNQIKIKKNWPKVQEKNILPLKSTFKLTLIKMFTLKYSQGVI